MLRRITLAIVTALVAGIGAMAVLAPRPFWTERARLPEQVMREAGPVGAPLRVFHLGHSLVGRDMPAMLAQMAGAGHDYQSQIGWGTSLREHWEPSLPVNGFEAENAHDHFRDAREAVASGDYDAVVLTEMVEIRDALKYHKSARYFDQWAQAALDANPDTRVYLYESWHRLDDPEGWTTRIEADLARYWEDGILLKSKAYQRGEGRVKLIPAGQAMLYFVNRLEAAGGIGTMTSREDLFARMPDGSIDPIHVNDLGAYLVALTHYAVLYRKSPVGLPAQLRRADGSPAVAPCDACARAMQESVWEVVRRYDQSGVTG